MKKNKKLLSLILSLAIICSCISVCGFSAAAEENDASDVSAAITTLKTEWEALRASRKEVYATPGGAVASSSYEELSASDIEKIGEKALYKAFSSSNDKKAVSYNSVGKGYQAYTDFENVKYTLTCKAITTGKFELKFYNNSWGGAYSIYPESYSANSFIVRELSNTSIKNIDKIQTIQAIYCTDITLYLGSIYVTYDAPIALPEGCDDFTAEQWVNAVYATDFSGCTLSEDFLSAFNTLEAAVNPELSTLKASLGTVYKTVKEVMAIPNATYRNTTADSTVLTDAQKEAFGEYYAHGTGVTMGYTYPSGMSGYKDYSGYTDVEFSISQLITNTSESFTFKIGLVNGSSYASWPYSEKNTLLTKSYSINILNGSKISYIQMEGKSGVELYTGCIFASYKEKLDLPENYSTFSEEKLMNSVYNTDFSDYSVSDEVKAAVKAVESKTGSGKALADLKTALGGLKQRKSELYAVPRNAVDTSTTDLSAAEKAALGPKVLYSESAEQIGYNAAEGSKGINGYSSLENVKYTVTLLFPEGKGSAQVKILNSSGDPMVEYWYGPIKNNLNTVVSDVENKAVAAFQVNNGNGVKMYMGSVYVSWDEDAELPDNYEMLSEDKLIEEIYSCDLSGVTLTEAFSNAFAAMKQSSITARSDVNSDYSRDAEDLSALKQLLLGTSSLAETAGDITGDGSTDIIDLVRLKKILAGI